MILLISFYLINRIISGDVSTSTRVQPDHRALCQGLLVIYPVVLLHGELKVMVR